MGRPLRYGMVGCALMGLPILLLAVEPQVALLLVAALLAGAGIEVFSMGWNLAMQENIPEEQLSRWFGRVEPAARVDNGVGLDNDEQGVPVWTATQRRVPWSEIWPQLRRLG